MSVQPVNETRALTVAHTLAWAIGAAWLLLVYLTPAPPAAIARIDAST